MTLKNLEKNRMKTVHLIQMEGKPENVQSDSDTTDTIWRAI